MFLLGIFTRKVCKCKETKAFLLKGTMPLFALFQIRLVNSSSYASPLHNFATLFHMELPHCFSITVLPPLSLSHLSLVAVEIIVTIISAAAAGEDELSLIPSAKSQGREALM
jgi:hypothetical protein